MAVDWEERYDFVALRTKRIAKVRAELRGCDLDAVLLWKNENVRYLTSLRAQIIAYKASSLNGVLLSPTSEPVLLCSGGELDKARFGMPWLASSHAIPIMEQRELVDGFVTDILTPQLRELGVTGGRLGIDQGNLSLIESIHKHLPNFQLTDADTVMQRARLIKLDEELPIIADARPIDHSVTQPPPDHAQVGPAQ